MTLDVWVLKEMYLKRSWTTAAFVSKGAKTSRSYVLV